MRETLAETSSSSFLAAVPLTLSPLHCSGELASSTGSDNPGSGACAPGSGCPVCVLEALLFPHLDFHSYTQTHPELPALFMFLWCLICTAEGSSALEGLKTECPAPASCLSWQHMSLQSLLATLTQPEPIHSTVPPDAPKDICHGEFLSERPAGRVLPQLITSSLLSMGFSQLHKSFCKTCRSGWKMRAPVGHT